MLKYLPMDSSSIINLVKSLSLPQDKFIVVGSGIMTMHGLKDAHDIDLVVSPEILKSYSKKTDWETKYYAYPEEIGKTYLQNSDLEMYLDVNYGNFNPTLDELLGRAEYFDDIPFISLEDLIKFKTEYNRPKDHIDIQKIKTYLHRGESDLEI